MSTTTRVMAGRYRVDDLIGRGGMAHVHRGYDLTLGRDVAIKILDRELARDTAFRTRFRMEAQAASRMSHPSIVRVFDAGEDSSAEAGGTAAEPVPFIVMELVHGELLKRRHRPGPCAHRRTRSATRTGSSRRSSTRTAPASCTATSSRATS